MGQSVWGSEREHRLWEFAKIVKREQYTVVTCLRVSFVLFTWCMISHTAFLLYGCYAALTSPLSLFAVFHSSYRPLGQWMNESGQKQWKYMKVLSPSGDFSVAYTQFMSNYGCQCGREIEEAFICPLAWFSISSMLLSSSLPVQVITAHLNA